MVGALGAELGQLRETFRLTPVSLWLLLGVAWSALASLGVLPLGGWALVLQVVGFAALSLFLLWPEAVARVLRSSDSFGVKERDSSRVVTYLPVALATFGLPFYLAAQAVLFKNVMQHLPGVLTGSTWSDAWRLSLDNLLFTELFLDLFDIFGVGLAPEQPGLTGKVLVFITRLLLSTGFVRLAVELLRATYYGALVSPWLTAPVVGHDAITTHVLRTRERLVGTVSKHTSATQRVGNALRWTWAFEQDGVVVAEGMDVALLAADGRMALLVVFEGASPPSLT